LRAMAAGLPGGGPALTAEVCDAAVAAVRGDEDVARGGFGRAPKFPPSALSEALLRHHERTGSVEALATLERACTAMARGGIYDQLAGGFARYSVDASWVVPHFEKMLYDNALLTRVYAHWWRITGNPLARKVCVETIEFMVNELGAGGMFASSLDADTEGQEGLTYVWTPAQLRAVLGDADGRWAADLFDVTEAGTFEHGSSVLQLRADPDDLDRFALARAALSAHRRDRPQPARDDKVVTAWNGFAITALAESSVALNDPELLSAAAACAHKLIDLHIVDGRLRRASLGGRVGDSAAILEDHAALATGLFTLHQLTSSEQWLSAALGLVDDAIAHFADPERPGHWFDAADDADRLVVRPADPVDGATPSGAALMAEALQLAAHLTSDDRYAGLATATLQSGTPLLLKAARSSGHWLTVAETAVRGPIQIAVACEADTSELLTAARALAPGGAIVVGGAADSSELLLGRDRIGGRDAAYVCRGRVCDLPVTTTEELATALNPSV
jgi:uncharacterized protein YyaL (SSP411 family)